MKDLLKDRVFAKKLEKQASVTQAGLGEKGAGRIMRKQMADVLN